ncbi:MAG: CidA/LrgA family protein [Blautia sp.]
MKYLRQFLIILLLSFLGEVLNRILPFPIPASVYGLMLLLTALLTGVLKVNQVKEAADFLIEIMPVMFIPAAAGLVDSWGILRPVIFPVGVITVISTVVVMAVTGLVTQGIIRKEKHK